ASRRSHRPGTGILPTGAVDRTRVWVAAATVGRKGCYELREALEGLDVRLLALGPCIESPDFWRGFDLERDAADWLVRARVIVLPAFVEHKPRRLVQAAAAGIPVIASTACGVAHVPGIELVSAGGAAGLRLEGMSARECALCG